MEAGIRGRVVVGEALRDVGRKQARRVAARFVLLARRDLRLGRLGCAAGKLHSKARDHEHRGQGGRHSPIGWAARGLTLESPSPAPRAGWIERQTVVRLAGRNVEREAHERDLPRLLM
jgi:hypothetical protein